MTHSITAHSPLTPSTGKTLARAAIAALAWFTNTNEPDDWRSR